MKRLLIIAITFSLIALPILFGRCNLFNKLNNEWNTVHGQNLSQSERTDKISAPKFHNALKAMHNRYIVVLKREFTDSLISELAGSNLDDQTIWQYLTPRISSIATEMAGRYGGKVHNIYVASIKGFAIEMTAADALKLSQEDSIEFIEEDALGSARAITKIKKVGTDAPLTNNLNKIDQKEQLSNTQANTQLDMQLNIHDRSKVNSAVDIYVLDKGIDERRAEFLNRASGESIVKLAYDAVDDDNDPTTSAQTDRYNAPAKDSIIDNNDPKRRTISSYAGSSSELIDGRDLSIDNHGTAVATIIANNSWNAINSATNNINILAVRVLPDGAGDIALASEVLDGIEWVRRDLKSDRAAVANFSFGFSVLSGSADNSIDMAIKSLINAGVTCVVAGPNSDKAAKTESPGRVEGCITVGATTVDNKRAYSNGPGLDLFAPQESTNNNIAKNVFSDNGIELHHEGTSFAAAMVTGVAASYLSEHTTNTPTQVANALIANALSNQITELDNSALNPQTPNLLLYNYLIKPSPLPTISYFDPLNAAPGALVRIYGTGLQITTKVFFNGTEGDFVPDVEGFVLLAFVPQNATSGPITVVTPRITLTTDRSFNVDPPNAPPPTISGFSPTRGPINTPVTITGTNFINTSQVQFNGINANFSVSADHNTITTSVPNGASTGSILVVTNSGSILSNSSFVVTPRITSFTPTSGQVTTPVTINGDNFFNINAVKFNGFPAQNFSVNPQGTVITTSVPDNATSGLITVFTLAGDFANSPDIFTVNPSTPTPTPAMISFINPTSVTVGQPITINGTNLAGVHTVRFANLNTNTTIDIPPTTISNTIITVATPNTVGNYNVTVLNDGGASNASSIMVMAPTAGLSISSISPNPAIVDSPITIKGNNLTDATAVYFTLGNLIVVATPNFINGDISTTAPHLPGTYSVALVNSTFTSSPVSLIVNSNALPVPSIAGINPNPAIAGTPIMISGTNLNFANLAKFTLNGTTTMASVFLNNGQITTQAPAFAGNYSVVLSGINGESGAVPLMVNPSTKPIIISYNPTSGPVGSDVSISGTNFANLLSVTFNGQPAMIVGTPTNTLIKVKVPQTTTGPLVVTTTNGSTVISPIFAVTPLAGLPQFTSISPATAPIGATIVINGNNFLSTTAVKFNGTNGLIDSPYFQIVSQFQMLVTVPVGTINGPITVVNGIGQSSSGLTFTVTAANPNAPSIISFSPIVASVGTEVTINGFNFDGLVRIKIGQTQLPFKSYSSSQIVFVVPANVSSGKITIETVTGSVVSIQNLVIR